MTNVKNERFVPIKNYVLAFVIVVVIILLTLYSFAWYNVFQEKKVSESYLIKEKVISNEITNLDSIEDVFSEAPSSYFVYVSYTGTKEVYNIEKKLKYVINDYNLNDSIYFLNVTEIKDKEKYIEKVNNALKLEDIKIEKVPTIIYFKEGKAVDITTRKDNNMIDDNDFKQLLDINNFKKDNN